MLREHFILSRRISAFFSTNLLLLGLSFSAAIGAELMAQDATQDAHSGPAVSVLVSGGEELVDFGDRLN